MKNRYITLYYILKSIPNKSNIEYESSIITHE